MRIKVDPLQTKDYYSPPDRTPTKPTPGHREPSAPDYARDADSGRSPLSSDESAMSNCTRESLSGSRSPLHYLQVTALINKLGVSSCIVVQAVALRSDNIK